jgi:hypothetical protein
MRMRFWLAALLCGCAMNGSYLGGEEEEPTPIEDNNNRDSDAPPGDHDSGTVDNPMNDAAPPPDSDPPDTMPPPPAMPNAAEIGTGDHTPSSVRFTTIATNVGTPRDLAFNPNRPDELWIVNGSDDSMTIVHDASTDKRWAERRRDVGAAHFMPRPSSISFGANYTTFGSIGTFATCAESRNGGDDFMGPTLWSSDLSIFAKKNPYGEGSHLDMLHVSPNCMGIAHQQANVYWAFGGLYNDIVKYDFREDHGIGQTDHSDGTAHHYVTGKVKYLPGVPSHLAYRASDAMLFICDAGNGRVAKLDTKSGTVGSRLASAEPMVVRAKVDGATLTDVVPASAKLVTTPSGIELRGKWLYVTDYATGRINAFSETGERVNYLDTGLPAKALAGITFGPDGRVYFVDMVGSKVLRIDPI